jgi:hypothetical protein
VKTAILFLLFVVLTVEGDSPVQIILGNPMAQAGSKVSVPADLSGQRKAVGLQFDVRFDSTRLSALAVSRGAAAMDHVIVTALPAIGMQRIVIFSPINSQLREGSVVDLLYQLTALKSGESSPLILYNVIIADAAGNKIEPFILINGSITVTQGNLPQLGSIVFSPDGQIHFEVSSSDNGIFLIQTSTDLFNWVDAGHVEVVNGYARFSDKSISTVGQRFYRAVRE